MDGDSNGFMLPGWEPERMAHVKELFALYKDVTEEKLFDNLVQHIRQVSDGMQDVSRQMAEIASGNEEVIATSEELKNIAVKTADETDAISTAVNTQQSSQADVTAASQSLAELAQDLQKVIGRFKF